MAPLADEFIPWVHETSQDPTSTNWTTVAATLNSARGSSIAEGEHRGRMENESVLWIKILHVWSQAYTANRTRLEIEVVPISDLGTSYLTASKHRVDDHPCHSRCD